MSISGVIRTINHLVKLADHDPQLISIFDTTPSEVNIEVWDIVDGQNIQIDIPNSGCYHIGDTDAWGWSTEYLGFTGETQKYHYYFMMISDLNEKQFGEFLINVPEGGLWSHPD